MVQETPRRDAPTATLNSIAQAVGVSRQTVSNVLNDPGRVAEPTRTRVRVGSATRPGSLSTLETVCRETPTAWAMELSVAVGASRRGVSCTITGPPCLVLPCRPADCGPAPDSIVQHGLYLWC